MKREIADLILRALNELVRSGKIALARSPELSLARPKVESFGDYASNVAMLIAKQQDLRPAELAGTIAEAISRLDGEGVLKKIDVAPQGFINFTLSRPFCIKKLKAVIKEGEKFGRVSIGGGKKVLIEFVSANPTGPLHVGHGRWAAIGDAMAEILKLAGFRVEKEFYVNDIGRQVDLLARSVLARAKGEDVPEGGYGGAYVIELAKKLAGSLKARDLDRKAIGRILADQRETLQRMGVRFDKWSFESDLHRGRKIQKAIDSLKDGGVTFVEGGALWFKSKEMGDDKNRVLVREDGASTYFASDIAYHIEKFKRGYDLLINVWGTDHHGYVARLKAALKCLGYPDDRLRIIIGQLVSLFRAGEPVRMSKRTGELITLREVMDEIGVDATRFYFLMLSADSHLEFDLEVAKKHSMDNPVYYVQYAHARISSILAEAKKAGIGLRGADLDLLGDEEELRLIRKIASYPDEVAEAATQLLPHRLINYARELSAQFHNFYHKLRVISDDRKLSSSRLALVFATRIVLRNVLKSLGITQPERM